MKETVDTIRCVRTKKYKYIRNFLPKRPYLQPCAYKDAKAILIALREWNGAGKLDEVQSLLFRDERPVEELYDVGQDPHEIKNLAGDPAYAGKLKEMRDRLEVWMEETGDKGREPESAVMFDSDMAVYTGALRARKRSPEHIATIERNIALMRRWAKEGK